MLPVLCHILEYSAIPIPQSEFMGANFFREDSSKKIVTCEDVTPQPTENRPPGAARIEPGEGKRPPEKV